LQRIVWLVEIECTDQNAFGGQGVWILEQVNKFHNDSPF
jgi:hypothetical protein